MKVLFVCTGNTCRSPMAEAIARGEAKKLNLNFEFSSAGIFAVKGEAATLNACEALDTMGYSLCNHIADVLTKDMLEEADIVITLSENHRSYIIGLYPEYEHKVFTLLPYVGGKGDVDDPFGGDLTTYRLCAEKIKETVIKLLLKLKER